MCRDAFAGDPKLADNFDNGNRYAGACAAARAGSGQGEDANDLDDEARAGWRKKALEWLRAELALHKKQSDGGKPDDRGVAAWALRYWQKDTALAGVRGPAELAKLPTDEREAWRKLWADVNALAQKEQEK